MSAFFRTGPSGAAGPAPRPFWRRGPTPPPSAARDGLERRHAILAAAIPQGFGLYRVVRDPSGAVADLIATEANAALADLFGQADELVGRSIARVGPSGAVDWMGMAASAMRTGAVVECEAFVQRLGRSLAISLRQVGPDDLILFAADQTAIRRSEQIQAELFQELNHRVNNSLATVAGILRMQARATDQDDSRHALLKAADRVQAIAQVHESLHRSGRKGTVDLDLYVTDLCRRLGASLLGDDRVRLEVHAARVMAPIEQAAPLGVIINELVTNAVKYAHPDGEKGLITVGVCPVSEGLLVTVSDDGGGVLGDVPAAGGLGMVLVRSLVGQMGGQLEVHQRSPGLTFEIRAPVIWTRPPAPVQASLI